MFDQSRWPRWARLMAILGAQLGYLVFALGSAEVLAQNVTIERVTVVSSERQSLLPNVLSRSAMAVSWRFQRIGSR
jgi:hypothetical protein